MPLLNTYTTEVKSDLQLWEVYTKDKQIINTVLRGHYVYILKATISVFLQTS